MNAANPTPEADEDFDDCPLCGRPLTPVIEPTEYGWEWAGQCTDCNTLVEIN